MAMFGLFNYSKPGKGVSKNAPEKKRFFLFFELYFRKFWKLLTLNFLYAVIIFPFLSAFVLWTFSMFQIDLTEFADDITMYLFSLTAAGLPVPLNYILIGISAVLMGPSTAAMTYIYRQFARQEHAWIWSDFWERLRSNFKQGFCMGLLDIIVLVSMVMYMSMQLSGATTAGQLLAVLRYVAVIFFAIYMVMRFYTYLIMVTFEMPLIAILRNSWIFTILGLVRNLCSILFCGLVIVATLFMPIPMLLLLTFSLTGFITTFNAYPVMEKYMLKPRQENEDGTITILEDVKEDGEESVFSDDVSSPADDEEVKVSNYDEVMRNREAYQNNAMLPSFDKKDENNAAEDNTVEDNGVE